MEVKVVNLSAEPVGEASLADDVFGVEARGDILHRVVNWQLAKRRAGTHRVKSRGEIVASTRKIYKQKGTGRARHGALSAPQFRGGGVVHGPQVRDHGYALPKKVRKLGLRMAVADKAQSSHLVVFKTDEAPKKAKELRQAVTSMGLGKSLFVVNDDQHGDFVMAASNLPDVNVIPVAGLNVYDILKNEHLVIDNEALAAVEARLR